VKRGKPMRRTPLRRGRPLRGRSTKATERLAERRRRWRERYGVRPDCWTEGIVPACPRWPHRAETGHEPARRSQGADETDPAQGFPICDLGHRWIHDHPAEAARLRTRDGRALLVLDSPD
jgi:hypothetical protein